MVFSLLKRASFGESWGGPLFDAWQLKNQKENEIYRIILKKHIQMREKLQKMRAFIWNSSEKSQKSCIFVAILALQRVELWRKSRNNAWICANPISIWHTLYIFATINAPWLGRLGQKSQENERNRIISPQI